MFWLNLIRLLVGVGILYVGAVSLVRGSTGIARAFGVKPLVIGLTVIAYGTSAPELAVSTAAVVDHAQSIALGTVIGACAANISLILGITALISPPTVTPRIISRELPILLGSVIAIPLCLADGRITRFEGGLLIVCAVLFTIVTLTFSARTDDESADSEKPSPQKQSRVLALLLAALGLLLVVVGAGVFLRGARGMAAEAGMSERLIGLTVIALGTSLPELIAAIIAATRKHSDLVVGSVIGSNLLNVFLVLGVVAYMHPIEATVHVVDVVGLLSITLLGIFMLRGSRTISRIEGLVLVLAYVAFLVSAVLL